MIQKNYLHNILTSNASIEVYFSGWLHNSSSVHGSPFSPCTFILKNKRAFVVKTYPYVIQSIQAQEGVNRNKSDRCVSSNT
jgi:hypothetical protein